MVIIHLQLVNQEQSLQELQEEKLRLHEHSQRLEQETSALHAELETQSLALSEQHSLIETKVPRHSSKSAVWFTHGRNSSNS